MHPRDTVPAIAPKTADIGSAFYFHPDTLAMAKGLGLDGFRMYFLGRGGVLGDVEPAVVSSAFGYFEPGMLAHMWNTAKAIMPPRDAARAYMGANHALGRAKLSEVAGLDEYADAAAAIVAAVDVGGYPLFAGVRAEPVPPDAPARAIHLGMVLRELRGSAHLAAIRAAGLDTRVAHAIKRPNDVEMFGWKQSPDVTDDDRARHAQAESTTNEMLAPAFGVLDESGAAALVDGTDAIHAALKS
ncbi:MAG: SCO6745 family protein [Ilumatobacteraceae bacterium]